MHGKVRTPHYKSVSITKDRITVNGEIAHRRELVQSLRLCILSIDRSASETKSLAQMMKVV